MTMLTTEEKHQRGCMNYKTTHGKKLETKVSQLWSRLKYMQTIWLYLLSFCSWIFNFFFFHLFSLHNGNLHFCVLHPSNPWTIRYQALPWGRAISSPCPIWYHPQLCRTQHSNRMLNCRRAEWRVETKYFCLPQQERGFMDSYLLMYHGVQSKVRTSSWHLR